jgi:hypothetical protein
MTRNGSGRSILFALVALLFGCGTLGSCRERIYLSKEEIEARIRKELPLGSSAEQVKAFVNSYSPRFETQVSDYEELVPEPPYRCAPDEQLPQAQGYIWGGMRRTGSAPQHMAILNIRLCFYFDKNRTLVEHKLEQIETY